ncbi:hypothetical protein BJ742DRAFT_703289 [Cladochytrium replicatum]|nr:hypothetical protein BJ742DRAFT_703289 [Cladochytrium replicatum]
MSSFPTRIAKLLGVGVDDAKEILKFTDTMGTSEEVAEHLSGMLGSSDAAVTLIHEYSIARFRPNSKAPANAGRGEARGSDSPGRGKPQSPSLQPKQSPIQLGSPKSSGGSVLKITGPVAGKRGGGSTQQQRGNKKDKKAAVDMAEIEAQAKVGNHGPGWGGRIFCECLAQTHGLVTNCLSCGKIICKLEGAGPCPGCGTQVESREQQLQLIQARKRKAPSGKDPVQGARYSHRAGGQRGYGSVAGGPKVEDSTQFPSLATEDERLIRAEQQKERLLEYDRNSAARTRVHDLASDFDYQSAIGDKWLSQEERALAVKAARDAEQAEEERRRTRTLTIDLENRTVREVAPTSAPRVSEVLAKATKENVRPPPPSISRSDNTAKGGAFFNPNLRKAPTFVVVRISEKQKDEAHLTMAQRKKLGSAKATTTVKAQISNPNARGTEKPNAAKWAALKRRRGGRVQHELSASGDGFDGYDSLDVAEPECG